MKTLFQPFKQTQRLTGGTGLGLYSLAKRVEALHGRYGVDRRRDGQQGSLFWFTIPYRPDKTAIREKENEKEKEDEVPNADVELATATASSDPHLIRTIEVHSPATAAVVVEEKKSEEISPAPNTPLQGLSILIVDDVPSILKMSSMLLRRQGCATETAQNGEIAVKKVESEWLDHSRQYHVILMDLQMPVMDGLEATRRIRAMEQGDGTDDSDQQSNRLPRQVIVGVSANSDRDTTTAAFAAGIDAFIEKPFSLAAFQQTVQPLLQL